VIATALSEQEVLARGVDGFGGCLAPPFLCWLVGAGDFESIDVTLTARGRGQGRLPRRSDLDDHPRVQLAQRLRSEVEVYGDERGFVTLSNGLAGRRELSIELPSEQQGRGLGRLLLYDALGLIPLGEPVFAAVAPGNARSLRAFLALGFRPLASEMVLLPRRAAADGAFFAPGPRLESVTLGPSNS
jgi:hypothetical protein